MFNFDNADVTRSEADLPDFASLRVGELFVFNSDEMEHPILRIKTSNNQYIHLDEKFKFDIRMVTSLNNPHATKVRRVELVVSKIKILD